MSNINNLTPEEFKKLLDGLLKEAEEHAGVVAKQDVDDVFADYRLKEEQKKLVYDFLLSRKIQVDGYEREPSEEEQEIGEEDRRFLANFQADLENVKKAGDGEWEQLIRKLKSENPEPEAKRRVAELMLPSVLGEAEKMHRSGVFLSDLVQEGSLALILAVDSADYSGCETEEDVRDLLMKSVRQGMQAFHAEQAETRSRDNKMVEKVQDFHDGVEILKEEYGRKVYLDEAADFMSISEEEAERILRLVGEEVPKDEDEK